MAVGTVSMRAVAAALMLAAGLWPAGAGAVECWRGWGYWLDGRTRAYKSEELLLVTRGPADWAPGQPVRLYLLDRATGRIVADQAPIVAVPLDPRSYYRGNLNYVDAIADVEGAADRLVFGLSHIPAPSAPIEKLQEYNRWACGLEGAGQ